MKKQIVKLTSITLILFLLQACMTPQTEEQGEYIGKKDLTLNSDRMTPEVLWSFGRVSSMSVSPDNQTVLYRIAYYDIPQNKGNGDLYTISVDGTNLKQITKTNKSESSPGWTPDGKKISFMFGGQLWEMNPDGSNRKQITFVDGGITGYKYSPDMTKLIYTKEVKVDQDVRDMNPDLPLATGRLENDLQYRHWDQWVDTYSHVFYADYDGTKIWNDKDINKGERFQTPLKPWGGIEQVSWTTDSKGIAYTSKKLYGKAATLSTNSDIYFYSIEEDAAVNMTKGMMGFDIAPTFSPDGNYMAWESMERDGYESDKNRLYIADLKTGTLVYATKDFDQNVGNITWSSDSKEIYFNSDWHGAFQIYKYTLDSGIIKQITEGLHDYGAFALAGDKIIAPKQTMSLPTELFAINPETGESKQITFTNKDLLGQLSMGKVEERWIKTDDNQDLQVFVIYPPNFDPNKKYPTLLYCKGGPQGPLSQSFHYRWNYQIMAANDYIIVAPARRGVSGFGQAWQEQISGDYHGKSMQDYLNAIDAMAKEPFVDEDRLGAIGASAGGWAVYYLAGHHEGRFKAFVAHDGIFNEEAQYLETEEMWFENWDKGGAFWEKDNKIAQEAYAHSPHKFVDKWDTPILCIHGELDYRVVVTQGMTAFNAAILNGVPAEYLYFPDENHWVLQPQNAILWQRTFFNWLDKWLK